MKKRGSFLLFILIIVIASIAVSGCGKEGVYEKTKRGYNAVTDVPGIVFDIPAGFAEYATAVSGISETMEFDPSNTYVYKDLSGKYFLFCMDAIVVAAQKNSSFGIRSTEDIPAVIEKTDLFGIWFTRTGKKLSYEQSNKNGKTKVIADVNASVSLTRDLFGDFTGKLAVIDDGVTEWAVFCGVLQDQYENATKDTLEGLSHMAKSCNINNSAAIFPEEQLVVAETDASPVEEMPTAEETALSAPEAAENGAAQEESGQEVAITEETAQAADETEIFIETNEAPQKKKSISLNNQRQGKTKNATAYSTVYSTLKEGDSGYLDVFCRESMSVKEEIVKLTGVYRGKEAAALLDKCLGEKYEAASAGTTWQVAEYEITYADEERPYINVMLTGMDGENLRYRGIRYTKMTADISMDGKTYAYYQVPNGCTEYLIKFGDCPVAGSHSAYYKIYAEE